MQKNYYRKINDSKERLRIVLASLQPGVNKSELCRKEGIYLQQLIRWTQEALQGAEGALKRKPRKTKERCFEVVDQAIRYLSLKIISCHHADGIKRRGIYHDKLEEKKHQS